MKNRSIPFLLKYFFIALCSTFLFSYGCNNASTQKKTSAVSSVLDPKQHGGGYVSDGDSILGYGTVEELNKIIEPLDKAGTVQIAVVALNSIGEKVPKDFAHELFNYWKIGNSQTRNGLLILLVKDQRRIEFETGYGMEGSLPDITCKKIQQEKMLPYFRQGNYDAGLMAGVNEIGKVLNSVPSISTDPAPEIAENSTVATTQADTPVIKPKNKTSKKRKYKLAPLTDTAITLDTHNTYPSGTDEMKTDLVAPPATYDDSVNGNPDNINSNEHAYDNSNDYTSTPSPGNWFGRNFILGWIVTLFIYLVFAGKIFFGRKRDPSSDSHYYDEWIFTNNSNLKWLIVLPPVFAFVWVGFFSSSLWWPLMIGSYFTLAIYMHIRFNKIKERAHEIVLATDRCRMYNVLDILHYKYRYAYKLFPLLSSKYKALENEMNNIRDTPCVCSKCGKPMSKLDKKAEKKFLDKFQVIEEKLESVDYDVWYCATCDTHEIYDFENLASDVTHCPQCTHKTYKMIKREVYTEATEDYQGSGAYHYLCYSCDYKHDEPFTIARIQSSSSSSSSSDSSSSSSSDSSWGGGDSGGGGAGSSW